MSEIQVQKLNWREWTSCAPAWERIHAVSVDASYFLSRQWVECWLAIYGESLSPDILRFVKDDVDIGYCLLVWRTQWKRGIPLRRVYLNCAGENEADSTCTEYNSLLSLPEFAEPVAKALRAFLRTKYWDEFLLDGMVENPRVDAVLGSLGNERIATRPSHFIDMARIRSNDATVDSILSSNTRTQIRRSLRIYEEANGPCNLRIAESAAEAAEMLTRLADLHQAAWVDRGEPGVFVSPLFVNFHRRLIQAEFQHQRMLLVELRAGADIIGVLYSFQYRGRVYFYQSGFLYTTDSKLKPGMISHYLNIKYCLARAEINEYDFLAGDSQYKRSLGTDVRQLRWIIVRRNTPSSLLFRGLNWIKWTYANAVQETRKKAKLPRGDGHSTDLSVPVVEASRVDPRPSE